MTPRRFAVFCVGGWFVFPPLALVVVAWWTLAQLKGPHPRSIVPGAVCFVLLLAVQALVVYFVFGPPGVRGGTSPLEFILLLPVFFGVPIGCFVYLWRSYGGTSTPPPA